MKVQQLMMTFGLLLAYAGAAAVPPVPESPIMKPVIDPPIPTEETPISIYFRTGPCEFIWDTPDKADLVRDGTQLDLVVDGGVTNGIFCNAGSGVVRFDIGSLPAGTYRLRIVIREEGEPTLTWPYDATATEFTVASAHAVPVGSTWLWPLLVIALAATAARRRKVTPPT